MTHAARPASPWTTSAVPMLFVFAIAAAVTSWAVRPYLVGVYHDDGVYALLAQSIARGQGFHYSHLPGAPAATHFPPVYPLMLAAIAKLNPEFPGNVITMLRVNVVLVATAAAGWFAFARRQLAFSVAASAAGGLAFTLALPTLTLASALMSETLFLALLWPALVMCERAARSRDTRNAILAGLVIGVLMLVRTHTAALLLALGAVMVTRTMYRQLGFMSGAAILVQAPWYVWLRTAAPPVAEPLSGSYGSYLGWFVRGVKEGGTPFLSATLAKNMHEIWLFVADRFAAGLPDVIQMLVVCVVLVSGVTGLWHYRRHVPVTGIFIAAYLAVVLVWPYTPWRFVWAIWPLLGLSACAGGAVLWKAAGRLSGRFPYRAAVAVLVAIPVLAMARVELHAYAKREWRRPINDASAQILPVVRWARTNVRRSDVVLTEGETVVALYDTLRAAPPVSFTAREYIDPRVGPEAAAAQLREMLRSVPARYVILLNPDRLSAASAMISGSPRLRPLQAVGSGMAFEVLQ